MNVSSFSPVSSRYTAPSSRDEGPPVRVATRAMRVEAARVESPRVESPQLRLPKLRLPQLGFGALSTSQAFGVAVALTLTLGLIPAGLIGLLAGEIALAAGAAAFAPAFLIAGGIALLVELVGLTLALKGFSLPAPAR